MGAGHSGGESRVALESLAPHSRDIREFRGQQSEQFELYVAMTRAQQELHLFGSGEFPLLHKLRHNQCFRQETDAAASPPLDIPLSA